LNTRHKHLSVLALVTTAVLAALAPLPPTFIERTYSTVLYPHVQRLITSGSNLVPVALFDVFVLAIIAAWLLALIRDIRRRRWIVPALMRSIVWASALYIAFVFLWGFNYRRVKLRDKLQFHSQSITRESAYSLASTAIDRLNTMHDQAHASAPVPFESIEPELANGYNRAEA
jgi:hypothetical protein